MKFGVYATRTEAVEALMVQRDTFGQSHVVSMDAGTLTISLPDTPADSTSSESLVDDPDNADHAWFSVDTVKLKAEITAPVHFSGTEDEFNSIKVHRCSSSQRAMDSAQSVLDDGFDLWKRTLRWTGFAPNIGIDEVETNYSATHGRGYKMFRASDGILFRGFGGLTTSHGHSKVSREAWQSAKNALELSEAPPVWFDYLHEATRMTTIGNFRSAVIYSAISAETVMRAAFEATLPAISSKTANRILERTPIQGLLGSFHDILKITDAEFENRGKSSVRQLFRTRNIVMHQGLREANALSDIKLLQPKIAVFAKQTDEFINETRGNPVRVFPATNHLD